MTLCRSIPSRRHPSPFATKNRTEMKTNTIQLFYNPPGNLRMTVDDRSYPGVKLFLAWPLTSKTRHLSLVDSKGDEITMVEKTCHPIPVRSPRRKSGGGI